VMTEQQRADIVLALRLATQWDEVTVDGHTLGGDPSTADSDGPGPDPQQCRGVNPGRLTPTRPKPRYDARGERSPLDAFCFPGKALDNLFAWPSLVPFGKVFDNLSVNRQPAPASRRGKKIPARRKGKRD
jgi:hypothetical protein